MYMRYFNSFNPEVDRKIRCLAARFLLGSEDDISLDEMTRHNYVIDNEPDYRRTSYQKPMLTIAERDQVYKLAGRRL